MKSVLSFDPSMLSLIGTNFSYFRKKQPTCKSNYVPCNVFLNFLYCTAWFDRNMLLLSGFIIYKCCCLRPVQLVDKFLYSFAEFPSESEHLVVPKEVIISFEPISESST